MLAQWSHGPRAIQFREARNEPLITLGSAPLHVPEFRAVVLGQLGESRLDAAIDADLAGEMARAATLDADAKGALQGIHQRVGTAILFESSGGQSTGRLTSRSCGSRSASRRSIRPQSIAPATALESFSFFVRKTGTDGYRIHHQPTLRKVVSDRRASLDDETEIQPAIRRLVETAFTDHAPLHQSVSLRTAAAVPDSPRLMLVVADPSWEWRGGDEIAERIASWTKQRGSSPRLYPASLVWCVRRPGRDLRESVELSLAWQRVEREMSQGSLGEEFTQADRADVRHHGEDAEDVARDEIWGGLPLRVVSDASSDSGLKVIDLGAGHASGSDTLGGRVVSALKSEGLLNESVGSSYIERHWPPAFKESGAWPLVSLRQSFLTAHSLA